MKKIKTLCLIALAMILLASCHQKRVTADIKPQSTKIEGYLGDYLQIVDGTYKIEKDNAAVFNWVVGVKVKAIKAFPENFNDFKKEGGRLFLNFFDDNGFPLGDFDQTNVDNSDTQLADILKNGSGEASVKFIKMHDDKTEVLPKKIASFNAISEKVETLLPGTGHKTASKDTSNKTK